MKTFSFPTKLFLFSTLLATAVECGGSDPGTGPGPGTGETTTVQGRVVDSSGTQAQNYGGAGSSAKCVKAQVVQIKADGSLVVLSEGAFKADGTYSLKVAAGLKGLIVRGLDASNNVVASAILEATGSVGGSVTATPMDVESSIEAEVWAKSATLGVALEELNPIALREHITTEAAVALKAAADFEAKIKAVAEAEVAAEVAEVKAYAAFGISTTQSALFNAQLAAVQKLNATLHAAGSASASVYAQAYLTFHNELRASLLAIDASIKKHVRAVACSNLAFRAVVKARLNADVTADVLLRAAASVEARASAAAVSSILVAGAAAADATTLATNAAVQLSTQLSASASAAASAAAFVSYNTAIAGSGTVTGSVLGTYLGVDATTAVTLQAAVTAVASASAALDASLRITATALAATTGTIDFNALAQSCVTAYAAFYAAVDAQANVLASFSVKAAATLDVLATAYGSFRLP